MWRDRVEGGKSQEPIIKRPHRVKGWSIANPGILISTVHLVAASAVTHRQLLTVTRIAHNRDLHRRFFDRSHREGNLSSILSKIGNRRTARVAQQPVDKSQVIRVTQCRPVRLEVHCLTRRQRKNGDTVLGLLNHQSQVASGFDPVKPNASFQGKSGYDVLNQVGRHGAIVRQTQCVGLRLADEQCAQPRSNQKFYCFSNQLTPPRNIETSHCNHDIGDRYERR